MCDFDPRTFTESVLLIVKRDQTTWEEFSSGDWIGRLADVLPHLEEAQQSFLQEYWERNPCVHHVGLDGQRVEYPLDDLCDLYAMASPAMPLPNRRITRLSVRCLTRLGAS